MLPQKRNDPRQGNQADQQRKNGEKKEIGKLRGPAGGPPQNPPRSANPGGHHASMRYSLRPSGLSCGILLPNFGIPIGRASLLWAPAKRPPYPVIQAFVPHGPLTSATCLRPGRKPVCAFRRLHVRAFARSPFFPQPTTMSALSCPISLPLPKAVPH